MAFDIILYQNMSEKNKQIYKGTRKDLVLQGYAACGSCKP